jgi:class 3 adenylate cyclase/tetratricopeptide (TPR) repeat protein
MSFGSVEDLLAQLGLSDYADLFEREEIDLAALQYLTDAHLKELGLPTGPRLKLLSAISAPQVHALPGPTPQAPPIPPVERRQLTVLFCDLVGSTALSQELDLEELRLLIRGYQDACVASIRRRGGYVAQYLGDGILAYFGYPAAMEDAASQAIHAALAILDDISKLSAESLRALQVRIGMDTGMVVIGQGSSLSEQERTAVGDAPNIAARLQALASPNTILVSARTRRLARDVCDFEDGGRYALKGIAAPVQVWRVSTETVGRVAPRAAAPAPAEIIGRESELDLGLRAWDRALQGKPQMLLVGGEPGIGKSRLVQALRARILDSSVGHWFFQCSQYLLHSALAPVVTQIEHQLRLSSIPDTDARLTHLRMELKDRLAMPDLDVALIGRLLGLPVPVQPVLDTMSAQKLKDETLRAVSTLTTAATRVGPLLVVFEDAHWADPTTIELLDMLRKAEGAPALILVTHRPEFVPPWASEPDVTTLSLTRLREDDVKAIALRTAGGKKLPPQILDQIVERTEGVPLYVEELTKTILESDTVEEHGDRYEVARAASEPAIPNSLRDSLMARLDRLRDHKSIAQVAACIGREFTPTLLMRVSGVSEAQLNAALGRLARSELVVRRGQDYAFKHALIQDAAYDSLLKATRAKVHARIAEVLEHDFPELLKQRPEQVAHHFTAAGELQRAIPHWQRAGELALQRMAVSDAIAHLDRGMAILVGNPDLPYRDEHELEICSSLAMAWITYQGWAHPNVLSNLDRAWILEQRLGRKDHRLRILWGMSVSRLCIGQIRESMSWALRLLDEGRREQSDDLTLTGHTAVLLAAYFLGEFRLVLSHSAAILHQYDPQRDHHIVQLVTVDPKTYALAYAALAKWMLGYPDQAVQLADEAVRHAQAQGHVFDIGWTLQMMAKHLDVYRREHSACGKKLDAFEELARIHHVGFFEHVIAPICRAAWHQIAGRPDSALNLFRESIHRWTDVGLGVDVPLYKTLYAQSAAATGDLTGALEIIDEVLDQVSRPGWDERSYLAEVLRVRGEILQGGGDVESAEREYRAAIAVAQEQSAMMLLLRSATSYAAMLHKQGRRNEAREVLRPAHTWFTEGFDTADYRESSAMLQLLD